MNTIYRGVEINVTREKSLGGWDEVYWCAYTKDGYEIADGFGGGSVRDCYKDMKARVDEFLDEYEGDIDKHIAAKNSGMF